MAYNSSYTGSEVDHAVGLTDKMIEFAWVYGDGMSPKKGISISSLPTRPGIGDRKGVYDVIYSDTTSDLSSSAGTPNISRITVWNENQHAAGTTNGFINSSGKAEQTGAQLQSGQFKVYHYDATGTVSEWYIHHIFRIQSINEPAANTADATIDTIASIFNGR